MTRFYLNRPDRSFLVLSTPCWSTPGGVARSRAMAAPGRCLWLLALLLVVANPLLAQDWNQIIKTAASDRYTRSSAGRSTNDFFGFSVGVDGIYAVVGVPSEDEDASGANTLTDAGSVILFKQVSGNWTQLKKIVASDRAAGDQFGRFVAISGNTVVVGANQQDQDAAGANSLTDAGAAYVFSKDQGGPDNWGQVKKIVASDRAAGDQFGNAVAISGNTVVVGAVQQDADAAGGNTLSNAGAAYVFSKDQGGSDNWGQVKKIVASDRAAGDQFGNAVAISGSTLVVGAYQEDEDAAGGNTIVGAGAAYVFSKDQGGPDNWGQVKKIVASDRALVDQFGYSVAISGNTVVVGANQEDEDAAGGNMLSNAGSAYVFSKDQGGSDNWGQVKKIVASDRTLVDQFGYSVAISGNTLVVGAYQQDADAAGGNTLSNAGAAYVFSKDQGGTDNWGQIKKIVASDRAADDLFGRFVAISGSTVVVGAYQEDQDAAGGNRRADAGSAYVFSQDQGGTDNWGQAQKIVLVDYRGGQQYGKSVSIDGDYAVVGANGDYLDASASQPLTGAGSAYILKKINGNWTQLKKIVASDRAASNGFGNAVAISGNTVVVGAYVESEDAAGGNTLIDAGSVYVFSQDQGGTDNWGQVKKIVPTDRAANDYFGYSVAISGNTLVVGAYLEDEDAAGGNTLVGAGSVYVFSKDQGGTDNWGQVKKIVASDRAGTDLFGISVAISGNTVVVGANQEDQDASGANTLIDAGSVYVFSKDQGGSDNWGQVKKIVASDRAANDGFGYSVAISGNTVVVGAFQEDEDAAGGNTLDGAGSVYVFNKDQGGSDNWGQVKKIVASDRAANDGFGYSVAISGNTLVVGAFLEDEDATGGNTLDGTGSAYVFSQDQGGSDNWGQVKKIVASDRGANDYFGISVAISGNTLVVGANQEDADASGANPLPVAGAAYLFESVGVSLTSFAAAPATVCAGSLTTFSATVGGVTGSYSYTLTDGVSSLSGITSSTTFSQTLTASGSGPQTYTLLISSNGSTTTATISLTVNPLPTASILLPASSTLNCTTTSLSLTATGGSSYQWEDNSTNAIRTVSSSGTYAVTVTDANGCTATADQTINSDLTQPVVSLTATDACAGQDVSLTTTPALINYTFYGPSGTLLAGTTNTTTISGLSANTYSFSVTAQHPTSFCSATATATATVSPVPSITITASPSLTIVQGQSAILTASGAGSFNWAIGETTASISVSVSGTYSVTGTNSGCTNSASVTVTVAPAVIISGLMATSSTVCLGNVATFTATVGNVTGSYDFTLTNGTNAVTGSTATAAFSQTVVVTGSGSQSFSLIVSNSGAMMVASTSLTVGNHPDYQALVDFYNSTNGSGWTNKSGWLTNCNPCSWYGVGCTAGRVTSITLPINQLSGTLPQSLSALTNLHTLILPANQLSGSIPASLSALTNLQNLTLNSNQLSGTIPESLSVLTNLHSLILAENELSGSIPASLSALTNLQMLNLGANGLSGSIPLQLSALTNLQQLDLAANQLSGNIPASLSALTTLNLLRLQGNQLSGSIPAGLGALTNLQELFLQNNQLSGSIPASLSALTKLQTILLQSNQLSGCYPASLTALCGVATKNFANNAGLPGGGSAAALAAFCSSGQGSDAFIATATASLSAVCVGSVVSLSTGGGSSYTWMAPAGALLTSSASSSVVSASLTTAGVQTFTVVVSSGGTCSQTATVSVTATANPSVSITPSSLTLNCTNPSATLTANGTGTLLWSTSSTNSPITITTAGIYSVTLTADGCTATASVTIGADQQAPTVSILASSTTLTCTTPTVSLSALGSGTVHWSTGSSTSAITVSTADTYSLTLTASNGCSSTATTSVSSNTVLSIVTGSSLPQANVGVVVSLTASGANSYQWTAPSTVSLTSPATSSAVSASLTTAGVQTFTLVATAGVCSQSALVSVTALAGPDLSAIVSLPDANFPPGGSKNLLMQLQEVNGSAASGSIVITITVPTGYSVSFDNTLTSIDVSGGSTVNVQNSKWQVSNNVANQQLSLTINGGESVGANSTLSLGFSISRTSANSGSTSNITVNVADDGGGSYDVNRLNNIYARIISGL